jgi:four helix bundle protein
MRDWKKLRVFNQADDLVIAIYRDSGSWPPDQRYSLTQQIQRAAVSVASNIVEGCSRASTRDYMRFIEIAYGSSCELEYQLSIASRLDFSLTTKELERDAKRLSKALNALLRAIPDARFPIPDTGERSEP